MASEDVEITHDKARDESRCGLFCDEEPDVSFEAFGYTFHRCRSCYEEPCSRCGEEIEDDSNKPKGWCQSCREEIRLICGGDEERGIEKDENSEQTTLMTDGGRDTGREESDWGESMSNSPNLGPLESLKVAWRRLRADPSREREGDWQRCDEHQLPAVCLGADLAHPRYRCPRCCRLDPQYGSDGMTVYGGRTAFHGRDDYLVGHEAAEGINL